MIVVSFVKEIGVEQWTLTISDPYLGPTQKIYYLSCRPAGLFPPFLFHPTFPQIPVNADPIASVAPLPPPPHGPCCAGTVIYLIVHAYGAAVVASTSY